MVIKEACKQRSDVVSRCLFVADGSSQQLVIFFYAKTCLTVEHLRWLETLLFPAPPAEPFAQRVTVGTRVVRNVAVPVCCVHLPEADVAPETCLLERDDARLDALAAKVFHSDSLALAYRASFTQHNDPSPEYTLLRDATLNNRLFKDTLTGANTDRLLKNVFRACTVVQAAVRHYKRDYPCVNVAYLGIDRMVVSVPLETLFNDLPLQLIALLRRYAYRETGCFVHDVQIQRTLVGARPLTQLHTIFATGLEPDATAAAAAALQVPVGAPAAGTSAAAGAAAATAKPAPPTPPPPRYAARRTPATGRRRTNAVTFDDSQSAATMQCAALFGDDDAADDADADDDDSASDGDGR